MPKLVVWTFALCSLLFPLGRAHAKPRVDPALNRATQRASDAVAPDTSKEEPAEAASTKGKDEPAQAVPEPKTEASTKRVAGERASSKAAQKTKRSVKVKPPCF